MGSNYLEVHQVYAHERDHQGPYLLDRLTDERVVLRVQLLHQFDEGKMELNPNRAVKDHVVIELSEKTQY
jgi:hypothetical protein